MYRPRYISLYQSGELLLRTNRAMEMLRNCCICPRNCEVDRLEGELGVCNTGELARVSSYFPHFGEEPPLVGYCGSGTIFFSYCSLKCIFCQNYTISHLGEGIEVSSNAIADMMLDLQRQGCHNINFVTPTHVVPQILEALLIAVEKGLCIPLVYNTGGYDSVETLKLLDGIIDIYMPDIKYSSSDIAKRLSKAGDYPDIARAAILEMHRQVGDLDMDKRGIAFKGLLVRHLVLPEGLAGTREAMRFLAREVSRNTYVNIMDQYHPCYKAKDHPLINRRITSEEYQEALKIAQEEGLHRIALLVG
ncbi:MAG: radical SAM protein [Nitrospirae bacterium GWA2_42_11]|nr:MAG: radical SAM protein [Nitrospirae bacterium GWA2_42_11]